MARPQPEQDRQANFFIRISRNPLIREEFCVGEKGVIFVNASRSGNEISKLKALGIRLMKQVVSYQGPQAEVSSPRSDSGPKLSRQNTGNVNDLIKFLKSQKKETKWIQEVLIRQLHNLDEPISSPPLAVELIEIDPYHALSIKRARRNFFEIKNRTERLQQAVDLLSESSGRPYPSFVSDVIEFLRSQAADMMFAVEEAERKIREISGTNGTRRFSEEDRDTKAIARKVEWEYRAEQYHQAAEAPPIISGQLEVAAKSSPLAFWKRIQ